MSHPTPARLLEVVEDDILPLTREGVRGGNKVFGAAILRKSNASLVVAGTNAETENPLWHGEISAIHRFYELAREDRPAPANCWFVSTHEPCSMCLSAIAWAGFDNFYYLFGYADTRDAFNIPHDLRMLQEIFGCDDGRYNRANHYWRGYAIADLVGEDPDLSARATQLKAIYDALSGAYQASKAESRIPLR